MSSFLLKLLEYIQHAAVRSQHPLYSEWIPLYFPEVERKQELNKLGIYSIDSIIGAGVPEGGLGDVKNLKEIITKSYNNLKCVDNNMSDIAQGIEQDDVGMKADEFRYDKFVV